MKFILFFSLLIGTQTIGFAKAQNYDFDNNQTIDGVSMKSGKDGDVRVYMGAMKKTFKANIETVLASVMDFKSRCNNEYKDRRKFIGEKYNCKHHNKNMIETVVEFNTKYKGKLAKDETDRFIMKRFIYNRGSFQHTELGRVFKYKNKKGQTTYKVVHRMMSDAEAKQYTDKIVEKDSAFLETKGVFILTEISKNETILDYKYSSKTDHWLLNKSMVVGEFFENMSKGVNSLFNALTTDVVAKN